MAVTVDIPGIGNVVANNAAEDATLKEILRALKGKGGSGGGGAGGGGGGAGSGSPSAVLAGLGSKLGTFGENIEGTTTIVQDFGKGVKTVTGKLMSGLTGLGGAAMDLGAELLSGGNRMSDFTQHIPLLGGAISSVVGFVEGNVDTFRDLSSVGASFGNDIVQMNLAASNAGMGLEQYAELIGNNSERMMLFGGTITEGANRFGKLTKDIRNSNKDFMGMGFRMEELNEHTAEYMEMQARQGRLQGMSDAQLRAGSEEYLMQIDRLAKVTGKSRKEAEALLKQQNAEANVLAIKMRLEGEQLKNFENGLAFVESELPGFAGAVKDMADGVAQTPLAQKLAATIPGFQELQTQLGKGNISQEDYIKKMAEFGPQIDGMLKEMSPAQIQALMGKEGFEGLLGGISDYSKMTAKYADMSMAEILKEQAARSEGTSGLTGFENAIAGTRAVINKAFIESGLFDKLTSTVGSFTEWFVGPGESGTSKLEEFTSGLIEWVSSTVKYLKEAWGAADAGDGMMDKIMNFIGVVWDDKISPAIGSAFTGLMGSIGTGIWNSIVDNLPNILLGLGAGVLLAITTPLSAPFLAIGAGLVAIFGIDFIKGIFQGAIDAFTAIGSFLGGLWDTAKPLFDPIFTAFSTIGGFFSGLWDKLTGWLPSWLVGDEEPEELKEEGKKKKSWWQWGSDDEDEVSSKKDPKADPATAMATRDPAPTADVVDQATAVADASDAMTPAQKAAKQTQTASASNTSAVNSSSGDLVALLVEQNKLLKQQLSATRALNGNLLRA